MVRIAFALALVACGSATPPPSPAPPPAKPVVAPALAATAPSVSGIWLGTLEAGPKGLRIQLHLDLASTPPSCTLDSLDQGAMGIPCDHVVASATALSFDVPAVRGGMKGTVSA